MKSFTDIIEENGIEFINSLMNDYVIISEKLNGSNFAMERKGTELKFYKGKDSKEITDVDKTMSNYYDFAIDHLNAVTESWCNDIPENWMFCFQYFPTNEPGNLAYDNIPKNHLVLTHIYLPIKTKVIEDEYIIKKWANRFEVDYNAPFFQGFMSVNQKDSLIKFISDADYKNGVMSTMSFAKYILQLLAPERSTSFLNDSPDKTIDSIIFKFMHENGSNVMSFKMVDPIFIQMMLDKSKSNTYYNDNNDIIILDFLSFIQ